MGQQSIYFNNSPSIIATGTICGPKEGESSMSKYFNHILKEDTFGEDSYEKTERKMLVYAINDALKDANKTIEDIDTMLFGDLLNQIISSSYAAREFNCSFLGLYGACSTFVEGLILSSVLIDGGYCKTVLSGSVSHFSSAERQYRYPLELGNQRPPTSQWTVTGAGVAILSNDKKGVKADVATVGKVIDFGVKDANNMGAAMAPCAADTIFAHFKETNRYINHYDLILTGDLGCLGSKLLIKLLKEKGLDIENIHKDCGEMIYEKKEELFQGGSGAGCCSLVFSSYIIKRMLNKKIKKVLFVATGALLSSTTSLQGDSIPGVAHAISLYI